MYPTSSRFGGGQEDAPSNPMRFLATVQLPLGEVWGFGVFGGVGRFNNYFISFFSYIPLEK